MNKGLLVAAALTLGLTGCKSLDGGETFRTAANNHFITVYIDPSARVIEVSVPELRVKGQDNVIFWTIQNATGQSYIFPEDGIFFKTEAGRAEFRCRRQHETRFRCQDLGENKGRFEYGIKVNGSPVVPTLDPFVVNN